MARDITFFLAADDATAAATRNTGPERVFTSLTFHGFDPDEAMVEWARCFEVPDDWPHYVADFLNDGAAVSVVSEALVSELAKATPDDLGGLAARWGEFLVRMGDEIGDEAMRDEWLTVAQGVAELARTAVASAGALRLYCWQWAP